MFNKQTAEISNKKTAETFIGPSVKVEGDFTGEGDLVIEGVVVGNVRTNNNLTIGPEAVVEAEIKAKNAFIAGKVKGNVTLKGKLDLTSSGQIIGNVKAAVLSVETGGIINGQLTMMQPTEKAASKERSVPHEGLELAEDKK